MTENHYSETCSAIPTGIWRPDERYGLQPEEMGELTRWFLETKHYYQEMIATGESLERGISNNFYFKMYEKEEKSCCEDIVPLFLRFSSEKVKDLFPHVTLAENMRHPSLKIIYICNPRMYLPFLEKEIVKMGGKLEIGKQVGSFAELESSFDLVINCSGMSAETLCDDKNMVPIRGQVSIVRAPWVKFGVHIDKSTYCLPGIEDLVVCGGSYQHGNSDLTVDQDEKQEYIEGCSKYFPALKKAEIVKDMVGIRPLRMGGPRVELEMWKTPGSVKKLPIIHNYGHGQDGYGFHWGTSGDVLKLFKRWWHSN